MSMEPNTCILPYHQVPMLTAGTATIKLISHERQISTMMVKHAVWRRCQWAMRAEAAAICACSRASHMNSEKCELGTSLPTKETLPSANTLDMVPNTTVAVLRRRIREPSQMSSGCDHIFHLGPTRGASWTRKTNCTAEVLSETQVVGCTLVCM